MEKSFNFFCVEAVPQPCSIIIFGASGDLARRKLFPALFRLFERDLMPERFSIIGFSRTSYSDEEFRTIAQSSMQDAGISPPKKFFSLFLQNVHYVSGDYNSINSYHALSAKIAEFEKNQPGSGRLFYFSTPPGLFSTILNMLGETKLAREDYDGIPWRRVVIEKPFGRDLASAAAIEKALAKTLRERQIFRIDHYLGKETVQNILMLRFANIVFEPIWNNRFIESVQITVSEDLGLGSRAGYFENTGLLRDMFQNHILQVLSLVAIEPPSTFDSDRIRDEKAKLLQAIRPFPQDPAKLANIIIRGQYTEGKIGGKAVKGYRQEEGVTADSITETYVSGRFHIDNWRWNGVHFYLRSGKRLSKKISEVAVKFRKIPHSIFRGYDAGEISRNELILTIQPDEGFSMKINAKRPGAKLCMGDVEMKFKYSQFGESMGEAYERLLLDAMLGDSTLFIRKDSIELSWALLDPVLKIWEDRENLKSNPLYFYPAGTEGPEESKKIFSVETDSWRKLS